VSGYLPRALAVALAVALALAACGKPATNGSTHVDKPLKPDDGGATFERGIAVTPTEPLLAWLDAQKRDGQPRLLRLPIVLAGGEFGGFDVSKARIGADPAALTVYANDAALGVGLADRATTACKDGASCGFWVEGYWRGSGDLGYQVDVMRIHGVIDDLATAGRVEVEGEAGN
jgi:hypothetical protein